MPLHSTRAWESSGLTSLPDYQKRSRRWDLFRGRNVSARDAGKRRILLRAGAALLGLTAVGVASVIAPLAGRPTKPALAMARTSPPTPVVAAAKPAKPHKKILWKTVVATAYCPHCRVCETTGITYTGREANPDGVAVARRGARAARLGTKLFIPGRGWLLVDDVGGGVESNQIDIRVSSHSEAVQFGRRHLRVGVVDSARS